VADFYSVSLCKGEEKELQANLDPKYGWEGSIGGEGGSKWRESDYHTFVL